MSQAPTPSAAIPPEPQGRAIRSPLAWGEARVRRTVERAAARAHAELVADAGAPARSRAYAALVAACLILALALLAVAALVWATVHARGFVAWILVGLGWLVVVMALPRPIRLADDVTVLDPTAYPAVHGLVTRLAATLGTPPPHVLAVDPSFNAYVSPLGWRGRPALVIGLPLWTALGWQARLGLIGHELGHVRGGDTRALRVVSASGSVLSSVVALCFGSDPTNPWRAVYPGLGRHFALDERIARMVLRVAGLPALAALVTLVRLSATSAQFREYLADRAAARATGSRGLADGLAVDPRGLHTLASAAVRRGEDPFAALAGRAAMRDWAAGDRTPPSQMPLAWDSTHPPTDLRIDLVERLAAPGSFAFSTSERAEVEAEMRALQSRLARRFSDELLES